MFKYGLIKAELNGKLLAWFPQCIEIQGLRQHTPGFSSGPPQMPPPSPAALQDIAICNTTATTPTSASPLHLNDATCLVWSVESKDGERMKHTACYKH